MRVAILALTMRIEPSRSQCDTNTMRPFIVMIGILVCTRERIEKNCRGFVEVHAMLSAVRRRLASVPFKCHALKVYPTAPPAPCSPRTPCTRLSPGTATSKGQPFTCELTGQTAKRHYESLCWRSARKPQREMVGGGVPDGVLNVPGVCEELGNGGEGVHSHASRVQRPTRLPFLRVAG